MDDGLVSVEKAIRNGRPISIVTYKKWQEFLPHPRMEEMRQPGCFDEIEAIVERSKRIRSS